MYHWVSCTVHADVACVHRSAIPRGGDAPAVLIATAVSPVTFGIVAVRVTALVAAFSVGAVALLITRNSPWVDAVFPDDAMAVHRIFAMSRHCSPVRAVVPVVIAA